MFFFCHDTLCWTFHIRTSQCLDGAETSGGGTKVRANIRFTEVFQKMVEEDVGLVNRGSG